MHVEAFTNRTGCRRWGHFADTGFQQTQAGKPPTTSNGTIYFTEQSLGFAINESRRSGKLAVPYGWRSTLRNLWRIAGVPKSAEAARLQASPSPHASREVREREKIMSKSCDDSIHSHRSDVVS